MVSFINHQLPLNPQVHNRPGHKGLFLCPFEKKNLQTTFDLGGGFKSFLLSPPIWGDDPIWRFAYVSKGLVQPPTSHVLQQGRLYGKERETETGPSNVWTTKLQRPQRVHFLHEPGSKLLVLGMVIQPLIGNPYNGYINPYYWVEFPIPYYMEIMGV